MTSKCLFQVQAELREVTAAKESAEAAALELRSAGEHSAMVDLAAAEARCAELEERLRAAKAAGPAAPPDQLGPDAKDSAGNGPPAMAGPGTCAFYHKVRASVCNEESRCRGLGRVTRQPCE